MRFSGLPACATVLGLAWDWNWNSLIKHIVLFCIKISVLNCGVFSSRFSAYISKCYCYLIVIFKERLHCIMWKCGRGIPVVRLCKVVWFAEKFPGCVIIQDRNCIVYGRLMFASWCNSEVEVIKAKMSEIPKVNFDPFVSLWKYRKFQPSFKYLSVV